MTECTYFRNFPSQTGDRKLFKMEHYLEIYDGLLAGWQGRDIRFLEIGVFKGGSIPMWQGFLGRDSRLVFLDIDPACRDLAQPGTVVEIGDQSDPEFLDRVAQAHGPFDLIVDDGGHKMHQQITSFRHLWPQLRDRGLYIVEDVHTSYWPGFGGGLREPASFIEFAKDLIDQMHSWYTEDDAGFPLHPLAREIGGIRFYDSLVVIEKRLKEPPVALTAQNGQVERSRRMLELRGRRSIF
ncbi:MAG TPA: class I SAM-dependent methyltransferase [Tabrizicola sp.]|nr:class I SAM-dependent methyltransferase [Tabrizicola sp.]